MEWAGIVHLCPCISLTCPDKARIVNYLKAGSNRPSLNLLKKGLLSEGLGEQYLFHQCQAYRHLEVGMRVFLAASEQLVISTRYQASHFSHPWVHMDPAMAVCCSLTWELTLNIVDAGMNGTVPGARHT